VVTSWNEYAIARRIRRAQKYVAPYAGLEDPTAAAELELQCVPPPASAKPRWVSGIAIVGAGREPECARRGVRADRRIAVDLAEAVLDGAPLP